jgi:excinuclease ABC subunit C
MRGQAGEALYVGKAASLRNRVSSYFASAAGLPPKIQSMVGQVADFEYIVTESEQEALILESNLIKEHRPPYNARLKDDKSYPFIKIDVSEDFPQVYVTRRVARDGSRYFGPFASSSSVRSTLALLKKLFPYRSCTKTITGTDPRPCLDFYIHRCVGPCIGAVNKEQYGEIIDQVVLFLEGKTDRVVKSIAQRMEEAAESLEFERAAVLRDQLRAIEKVHEGQKVLRLTSESMDVIAVAPGPREAWVEVFFIRQGKLIGRDNFLMEGTQDDEPGKILTAFVKQFYDVTPYVPPRILVQHPLEDLETIQGWLRDKRQGAVQVYAPERGEKRKLVEMVAENAAHGLEQLKVKQASDGVRLDSAMAELQDALGLPRPPRRIECYDISNIQGTNPVGSMVVFEDGKPKTAHYRRFKIKTVEGVDDYSMMREMLTRRFKRLARARDMGEGFQPVLDGGDGGEVSGVGCQGSGNRVQPIPRSLTPDPRPLSPSAPSASSASA